MLESSKVKQSLWEVRIQAAFRWHQTLAFAAFVPRSRKATNKALSEKVFLVEILWALFQFQCREMKADIWLPDSFSILIHFKIQQWSRLCQGKIPPLPSILLQQAKNIGEVFLNFLTHSTKQNNIHLFSIFSLSTLPTGQRLLSGSRGWGRSHRRPSRRALVPKVPTPFCLTCSHILNSRCISFHICSGNSIQLHVSGLCWSFCKFLICKCYL